MLGACHPVIVFKDNLHDLVLLFHHVGPMGRFHAIIWLGRKCLHSLSHLCQLPRSVLMAHCTGKLKAQGPSIDDLDDFG